MRPATEAAGRTPPSAVLRAAERWTSHAAKLAIDTRDTDAVRASTTARALVLERLLERQDVNDTSTPSAPSPPDDRRRANAHRDLYTACARLGGVLAAAGASPSLVAGTMLGASEALAAEGHAVDQTRLLGAHASVAEGYTQAIVELERASACAAWDYPACAVRIDAETLAVAASLPSDDPELVDAWACNVAGRASKEGVRRVIVSGSTPAVRALEGALGLVGIAIVRANPGGSDETLERPAEPSPPSPQRRWFRFWSKG